MPAPPEIRDDEGTTDGGDMVGGSGDVVPSSQESTIILDLAGIKKIEYHYAAPLTECDKMHFRQIGGWYYKRIKMAPEGMFARMGLKVGDKITAIDVKRMNDINVVAETATRLFYGKDALRGTNSFSMGVLGNGRRGRTSHP